MLMRQETQDRQTEREKGRMRQHEYLSTYRRYMCVCVEQGKAVGEGGSHSA